MPLDSRLVGHETQPIVYMIRAEDIRQFSDAVGDTNPIFRDPASAERAGFAGVPVMPTFVTRFQLPLAEAGLDPERSQVLHGEQEYEYSRPLVAGERITVRYRVAAIRQSSRKDGMAIEILEQIGEDATGERLVTGRATVIVRDAPHDVGAQQGADRTQTTGRASKPRASEPTGEPIPTLTKHVTQEQINAYADISGDHNPIHVNPEVARTVGLDGTIAHGMLSMAFLGQAVTNWISASSGQSGWVARLRARFQSMARPGDTLTCRGVVGESADGRRRLELWIDNQRGERIVSGDADVADMVG